MAELRMDDFVKNVGQRVAEGIKQKYVSRKVIEDIKAEIKDARFNQINDETEKAVNYGLNTALAIIDKHTKAESEGKE